MVSRDRVADGAPNHDSDGSTDPNRQDGDSRARPTVVPVARMAKHKDGRDSCSSDATDDHAPLNGSRRGATGGRRGELTCQHCGGGQCNERNLGAGRNTHSD